MEKLKELYQPGQNIGIDEGMVQWWGRLSFREKKDIFFFLFRGGNTQMTSHTLTHRIVNFVNNCSLFSNVKMCYIMCFLKINNYFCYQKPYSFFFVIFFIEGNHCSDVWSVTKRKNIYVKVIVLLDKFQNACFLHCLVRNWRFWWNLPMFYCWLLKNGKR